MPSSKVDFTRNDSLAVITLNRPEARHALSPDMVAEFGEAIARCRRPEIRAVMITGTGGAFCAGADVKDFAENLEGKGPEGLSQRLRPACRRPAPGRNYGNTTAGKAGSGRRQRGGRRSRVQPGPVLRPAGRRGRRPLHHGLRGYRLHRRRGLYLHAAPPGGDEPRPWKSTMASQPIGAEYARELGLVNQVCPAENFDRHSLGDGHPPGPGSHGRLRGGQGPVR